MSLHTQANENNRRRERAVFPALALYPAKLATEDFWTHARLASHSEHSVRATFPWEMTLCLTVYTLSPSLLAVLFRTPPKLLPFPLPPSPFPFFAPPFPCFFFSFPSSPPFFFLF